MGLTHPDDSYLADGESSDTSDVHASTRAGRFSVRKDDSWICTDSYKGNASSIAVSVDMLHCSPLCDVRVKKAIFEPSDSSKQANPDHRAPASFSALHRSQRGRP